MYTESQEDSMCSEDSMYTECQKIQSALNLRFNDSMCIEFKIQCALNLKRFNVNQKEILCV